MPCSRSDHGGKAHPDHRATAALGLGYLALSILALMLFPPGNWSAGGTPTPSTFVRAWTELPTWNDGDPWTTNYLGHPLMGSFLYLFARQTGHRPLRALVFATATSVFWEYALEGWFERPSAPDLLVTPTLGAVLGELRWRAASRLIDAELPGFTTQLLLFVVDPIAWAQFRLRGSCATTRAKASGVTEMLSRPASAKKAANSG